MKYQIVKLDGRYSYNDLFDYYIKFPGGMVNNRGPEQFNQAHRWFVETYGWSAEIRQWIDIQNWHSKVVPIMAVKGGWVRPQIKDAPPDCNLNWSWSNNYNDLRIYVASEKILSFFHLAHADNQ